MMTPERSSSAQAEGVVNRAPRASSVSVVVPCLNEAGSIERLLDAIRAQDYPPHEVIVSDCGSTDGTLEILERYEKDHPELPLSLLVRPQGTVPEAMNAGVAVSTGQIIVRLDAHSCPIDSYIRRSVRTLLETGAGVVGGVWNIAPGGTSATARGIALAVSHPFGVGDAAYRIGPRRRGRILVDTVPFGCFWRSTWEKIGGYNERLQTNEDYEFHYRVRQTGQPVILDSDVRCTYFARFTLKGLAAQYFRYGWWKAKMLKQHPRSIRLRQIIPPGFVSTLLALAGMSVKFEWSRWTVTGIILLYALALAAASMRVASKARDWTILPLLPATFATVHFAWGVGILVHLLTLGRWPRCSGPRIL